MPPALPESNFWWSSNLRPWGNMFLLSQAFVLETLHCSQSFLLSTVDRMGIRQKAPQIVNQWKRLPNCWKMEMFAKMLTNLFFPLGRVFWGFSGATWSTNRSNWIARCSEHPISVLDTIILYNCLMTSRNCSTNIPEKGGTKASSYNENPSTQQIACG